MILDSWLSLISAVIPLEVSDIFSAALKFDEFSWVVNARAFLWVSITVRSSRLEGDSQIVVFFILQIQQSVYLVEFDLIKDRLFSGENYWFWFFFRV